MTRPGVIAAVAVVSAFVGGTFALEFLDLPAEVLTTTLIHHQHYFPIESDDGKLKNAFLAVINTEPDNERTIARNAERVVTARLRDARLPRRSLALQGPGPGVRSGRPAARLDAARHVGNRRPDLKLPVGRRHEGERHEDAQMI